MDMELDPELVDEQTLSRLRRRLRQAEAHADEKAQLEVKAQREAAKARLERDGLRKMLEGTIEYLRATDRLPAEPEPVAESEPEPEPIADAAAEPAALNGADVPRGREAIRRIMREQPRDWRQKDLIDEVMRRHWIDPEAKTPHEAIRVAVRRMADKGELEKVETGVYRLKGSSGTPGEEAATAARGQTELLQEGDMPPPLE